jgi:hypothetical protein
MKRPLVVTAFAIAMLAASAALGAPRLVSSIPAHGTKNIPCDIGVLRFVFDTDMKQNQWSLLESDQGVFPPMPDEGAAVWTDARTFELSVLALEPGATYAVRLNSDRRQGFRSAMENEPLPETVVVFTTESGDAKPTRSISTPTLSTRSPLAANESDEPAKVGDIPGLEISSPPPDWIKPGLRLTYYTMASQMPKGPQEYKLDQHGRWVDKEGNRYSRENTVTRGSHGYTQFDIVGLDEQYAGVQMKFFVFDGMSTNNPRECLDVGDLANASTGGELWIHPDRLAQIAAEKRNQLPYNTDSTGFWVTQTQHKIDQATYNVVQIIAVTPDVRGVWMYDMASGILLYSSNVKTSSEEKAATGETLNDGESTMTFTEFRQSRQLNLPWMNAAPPAWVQSFNSMEYRGNFLVEGTGIAPTPIPLTMSGKASTRRADFLRMVFRMQASGPGQMPMAAPKVYGSCMIGGLWIPPTAMNTLQPGQVIDEDPRTQIVTRVASVDAQYVVISLTTHKSERYLKYRRDTGVLEHIRACDMLSDLTEMKNCIDLQLAGSQ